LTNKYLSKIKKNPVHSLLAAILFVLTLVAAFTDSITKIGSFIQWLSANLTAPHPSQSNNKTSSGNLAETVPALLEQIERLRKKDHSTLLAKYPEGYFLFASNRYSIIPSNPNVIGKFSLDWQSSKIRRIGHNLIHIVLRKFNYHPSDIQITNLNVVLDNRIGAIADGFYMNGIGMYFELLESDAESTTYVIGFRQGQPTDIPKKLSPFVESYVKELQLSLITINAHDKKHWSFETFLMASTSSSY